MRMMVSRLSWQPRDLAVAMVDGLIPLSMARRETHVMAHRKLLDAGHRIKHIFHQMLPPRSQNLAF